MRILLRSFKMHDMEIPKSLKAVGRAGAGVNNIPVEKLTKMGIPVFNAPGRECQRGEGTGDRRHAAGLPPYRPGLANSRAGFPAPTPRSARRWKPARRTSPASSCPAARSASSVWAPSGATVANGALALGMKVIGFDPGITVEGAWQLSADVKKANSVDELLRAAGFRDLPRAAHGMRPAI